MIDTRKMSSKKISELSNVEIVKKTKTLALGEYRFALLPKNIDLSVLIDFFNFAFTDYIMQVSSKHESELSKRFINLIEKYPELIEKINHEEEI